MERTFIQMYSRRVSDVDENLDLINKFEPRYSSNKDSLTSTHQAAGAAATQPYMYLIIRQYFQNGGIFIVVYQFRNI